MRDRELADLFAAADLGEFLEKATPAVVPLQVRDVVLDPVFARRPDALLRTAPCTTSRSVPSARTPDWPTSTSQFLPDGAGRRGIPRILWRAGGRRGSGLEPPAFSVRRPAHATSVRMLFSCRRDDTSKQQER